MNDNEITCENCGENIDDILYECIDCGNTVCDMCAKICKKCKEYFCDACHVDHKKECK